VDTHFIQLLKLPHLAKNNIFTKICIPILISLFLINAISEN
jgi:hypothetical protein